MSNRTIDGARRRTVLVPGGVTAVSRSRLRQQLPGIDTGARALVAANPWRAFRLLATALLGTAFATLGGTPAARAAEVTVLSAGAVEPGVHAFTRVAKAQTGHDLAVRYNTAPQIASRLQANEVYDLLIAPPPVIAQAAKDGKVKVGSAVPVGRVGVGIIVRGDGRAPPVGSVEELKAALLAADSIVYNTASTGLYLDRLFEKLGILADIKPKTTRYPDGASVMEHVIRGKGNEIGFGAITEIRMYEPKGLRMLGPLPTDVQNYTSYEAALMTSARAPDAASKVLEVLASPAGRSAFASAGVE